MVEAGANEITEAEMLDALDIAHARDQEAVRRPARAGRPRPPRRSSRSRRPSVDEDLYAPDPGVARRGARPGDERRGQARAPGRHEGRRGGGARAVLGRPGRRDVRRVPLARAARVRQAREGHDPPADRRPQEAPGRPLGEGDPADLDRGRAAAAHARLRALHARPDAGALGRRARHDARGDAAGQPRARDVQALLPPLQLPAVLGGRGRLHARPEAPRHRPRRARRARARADDPVAGGSSRTRSASCRTSSSPTARRRWRRSAAPRCR